MTLGSDIIDADLPTGMIDNITKNLIIYQVALGNIPQYWGQAMKSERWILSEKLHIDEKFTPMVRTFTITRW